MSRFSAARGWVRSLLHGPLHAEGLVSFFVRSFPSLKLILVQMGVHFLETTSDDILMKL